MKVLWITLKTPDLLLREYGEKGDCYGGWIDTLLLSLSKDEDMELAVLCPYGKVYGVQTVSGITYYTIPKGRPFYKGADLRQYLRRVNREWQPDVVHSHGTEFPLGLVWAEECGISNLLVSVQGLNGAIADHYLDGISSPGSYRTLRDILRHDSMQQQKRKFRIHARDERRLLGMLKYVAGRTDWDRTHVKALNPGARYFHVGEMIRPEFEGRRWDYSECEPHSIFVSQGAYPIKGIHMALRALNLVKKEFPDVRLYIAGSDPVHVPFWRLGGYGNYLRCEMKRLGLSHNVEFTGTLTASQMAERYLKSNLYLLCSSIENSPNSLAEAISLQMPVIASICGGTPEMTGWNPAALYRFEEYPALADMICGVFSKKGNPDIIVADKDRNGDDQILRALLEAYQEIYQNSVIEPQK